MKPKTLEALILHNGTGVVRGDFRLLISTAAFGALWALSQNPEDEDRKNDVKDLNMDQDQLALASSIAQDYRIYCSHNNESLGSYPIDPQSEGRDSFSGVLTLSTGEEVWVECVYEKGHEDELYGTFMAQRYVSKMGGVNGD